MLFERGLDGFEVAHDEKAAWNLPFCLFALFDLFAVGDGCVADVLVKETAERSEALKPDFETDVRDAQFISSEQFFRFLDAAFDQILVRSFVECLAKQTQKVITGKAGFLGNLIETQRVIVAVVDELTRPPETLQRLEVA